MRKKLALLGFAFLWIAALVLNGAFAASASNQFQHLSSAESDIVSRINGTSIYNYDVQLEKIALDHSQSLYSFRSSGSVGANESATWIQQQFESFGLETQAESFEFTTWNLVAQPVLIIDADGNLNTTNDQVTIPSFQCDHLSWPTPDNGTLANLVTLPSSYDPATYVAVNTTGKALLIAGGVQQKTSDSHLPFTRKIQTQTPAAILFEAPSGMPPMLSPSAGKNFWEIPVGWVSYGDGQLIRGMMAAENASAFVSVRAEIGQSPHYNVVAKLLGSVDPEKEIIISAHYDSVMDAAFCDDGAGTSAVLELAKVFSEASASPEGNYKPQYTLVFIAFAGGEFGLAGSVNYVKEHASELGNIVAVIDLDSIGSKTVEISKTFPDDRGLNLQSIVKSAGNDLGVTATVIDPAIKRSSDDEAFRDPVGTDEAYSELWGAASGISNLNLTRVESSIMIDSQPLTWIYTENDNSTSTATLGWVTVDNLQIQAQVAGLSVIRVLSTIFSPFLTELYVSLATVGGVVAVAAYLVRSRLKSFYEGFAREVRSFIGPKEVVYIIILTVIFLFLSFALNSRIGETEVINRGRPTIVSIEFFGTPFEMWGVSSGQIGTTEAGQLVGQPGGINILWGGLLANLVIFFLSAFVITYAVTRVRYARELSKSLNKV